MQTNCASWKGKQKRDTPKGCLRKYLAMRCPIRSGMTQCHYWHDSLSLLARLIVITGLTGNLLLVKRSSNVHSASNCTTYHWVVTDAEESHHLNVCWN